MVSFRCDSQPRFPWPPKIPRNWKTISGILFNNHNSRAIGRPFKTLDDAEIVHLNDSQWFGCADLKPAKPFAATFGFENCLRDDESEFAFWFQVFVGGDVKHQDGQIIFCAAETRAQSRMRMCRMRNVPEPQAGSSNRSSGERSDFSGVPL